MNYYEIICEQGSTKWHEARFGRIGGSSISKIIQNQKSLKTYTTTGMPNKLTKKQAEVYEFIGIHEFDRSTIKEGCNCSDSPIDTLLKNNLLIELETIITGKESLTDGAQSYLIEKVTELKYGVPHGLYRIEELRDYLYLDPSIDYDFVPIKRQEALEYGTEYEPEARAYFESEASLKVTQSGLLVHRKWPELSCSLDGQIRDVSENIEIKCPYSREAQTRLFITDKIKQEYIDQMQLGMAITGNDVCHFISYDPSLPSGDPFKMYTQIVKRDERRIEKIMTCAVNFIKVMRTEIDRFNLNHFYVEAE